MTGWFDAATEKMAEAYQAILRWSLAHKLATLASIEDSGAVVEHSQAWVDAAALYGGLFWKLTIAGVVLSLVAFAFVPLLRRGMHGVK